MATRPPRRRAAEQRDELASPHLCLDATVWRGLSGWFALHSGYHDAAAGPEMF
jgi:hypothetical protein